MIRAAVIAGQGRVTAGVSWDSLSPIGSPQFRRSQCNDSGRGKEGVKHARPEEELGCSREVGWKEGGGLG